MPPFSQLKDGNAYARPMTTKTKSKSMEFSSPSQNGRNVRRKRSRHQTPSRMSGMAKSFYAVDFAAVLLLLSMVAIYVLIFDGRSPEITDGLQLSMQTRKLSAYIPDHSQEMLSNGDNDELLHPNAAFEGSHKGAPECRPLEYYEVTYGLAIALKESDLNLVSRHCRRWGISAPISIAVWTELTPEQVMEELQSFVNTECTPQQLTISTLSPASKSRNRDTYPHNQLQNLAIQALQTTHAIPLDIHVLPSTGLYDILHSPSAVRELANDPKLAIVLPSFEAREASTHNEGIIWSIPDSFESLVMHLSTKTANIIGSNDIDLQGSTLYRSWVKQDPGALLSIDCVSSDYYEPFVAVRYCEGLPPFQEVLSDENDGDDGASNDLKSTWILHLIHLGYRFEQIGGGFVIGSLQPEIERVDAPAIQKASLRHKKHNRKFTRDTFLQWLHETIPEERRIEKCKDFEASTD